MRSLTSLMLACLLVLGSAAQAQADTVVLLGLRSVEGDDDFANDLTQALRRQLGRMSGVTLSDRAVSLSQMGMAYGCEEPDAACLTDIAAGLQTQHVIYGTVRRSSTRSDYQFSLNISFFSSESGSIENTVTHSIPQGDRNLDRQAEVVLSSLMGLEAETGSIMVRSSVPSAEVTVNDQAVGTTVDGSLRLSGLAPGRYQVVVSAPDMAMYRHTATVVAGESTTVSAELESDAPATANVDTEVHAGATSEDFTRGGGSDGTVGRIVGYSLLGVAALGIAGTIYSWAEISSINDDSDFKAYRTRVGMMDTAGAVDDVCSTDKPYAATNSPEYITWRDKVRGLCDDADLFETLQWVFLGTAVVAGGAGTYFLLTAGGGEQEDARAEAEPVVTFKPRVSRTAQSLEATFRF